jgi:hypothetical protein
MAAQVWSMPGRLMQQHPAAHLSEVQGMIGQDDEIG